jgi:hypothetical protein
MTFKAWFKDNWGRNPMTTKQRLGLRERHRRLVAQASVIDQELGQQAILLAFEDGARRAFITAALNAGYKPRIK